jgi:zinc transporter
VGGIPLATSPHGFSVVLVLIVTFTALAGWLAFRQKD